MFRTSIVDNVSRFALREAQSSCDNVSYLGESRSISIQKALSSLRKAPADYGRVTRVLDMIREQRARVRSRIPCWVKGHGKLEEEKASR